ncbi:hypothetical protein BaOVIS_007960 [Babesia ovis]|uniref:CCZ1/INTU/HSP4 first Longin domain-containing protein n=1 Tax=Babesia ovis TaxID=5869 RepID=A0A9W5T8X9_BABOV|nr:hypothetical protein BaOVIS_007960 [Babesia ovis]
MSRISTIFVFDLNRKPTSANPTDEEIQDAKLLYYYPEHCEVEERRSHFGLIEGLIGLLSTFTSNKIDFLKTKLFTTTISEWCPDVYLVVCFKNEEGSWNEMAEYSHHWKHLITKVVLENTKKMFELFYGPLSDLMKESEDGTSANLEKVRLAFDNFLPSFLTQTVGDSFNILKDWNATNKSHTGVVGALDSQNLIVDVCEEFKEVKGYMFIHNQEVLLSSLDLDNMMILYTFLIKNHGIAHKEPEYRLKNVDRIESEEVQILESDGGTAFGPRVHLNGHEYYLSVMCFESLYLVLLLQTDDLMLSLSNIKEYLTGMPHGLKALINSLSRTPSTSPLCTVSLNTATKAIRSIGYDSLDDKKLQELYIIRGIHHLIESNANRLKQIHVRSSAGWVNAQVSNSREMYLTLQSDRLGLNDVRNTFDEFVKTYLGGIYFI